MTDETRSAAEVKRETAEMAKVLQDAGIEPTQDNLQAHEERVQAEQLELARNAHAQEEYEKAEKEREQREAEEKRERERVDKERQREKDRATGRATAVEPKLPTPKAPAAEEPTAPARKPLPDTHLGEGGRK